MRVLAGHHERAQIALARTQLTGFRIDHIDVFELDDLLRDEPARFGFDAIGELPTLGCVKRRAEDHTIAARFGNILDHKLTDASEHLLAVLFEHRHVGRRIVQNRFLAQIVSNHGRHEIVDRLVVSGTIARCIDDRHIAGTICGKNARHADHGIRIECERIEIFVRQATVDHAHTMAFARIIKEIHLVVNHFKIFRKRQRGTGFFRQIGMLEKRRIVSPWRQHHGNALRGDEIHGLAQQTGIIAVVSHMHVTEQARRDPTFDIACEQRIAGTGRNAQIVFQHPPFAVLSLHQILACDMREHAARRGHAVDLREISCRSVYVFFGDNAVLDDFLIGIHVPQIGVQRIHALLETRLHLVEFVGFDDTGNRIIRKETVMVFAVLVNTETNAIAAQLAVDRLTAIHQFRRQPACSGFNHRFTLLLPLKRMPDSGPCLDRRERNGFRLP